MVVYSCHKFLFITSCTDVWTNFCHRGNVLAFFICTNIYIQFAGVLHVVILQSISFFKYSFMEATVHSLFMQLFCFFLKICQVSMICSFHFCKWHLVFAMCIFLLSVLCSVRCFTDISNNPSNQWQKAVLCKYLSPGYLW